MPSDTIISIENNRVCLAATNSLSEILDCGNSPVLFGCRTGICGTCLIQITAGSECLNAPSEDEKEFLEIVSEGRKDLRLACQVKSSGNFEFEYLGK